MLSPRWRNTTFAVFDAARALKGVEELNRVHAVNAERKAAAAERGETLAGEAIEQPDLGDGVAFMFELFEIGREMTAEESYSFGLISRDEAISQGYTPPE